MKRRLSGPDNALMRTRSGRPPTRRPKAYRLLGDERGVIVSWFAKMLVGFALVGLVLFEAGAIAVNYFGLDSAANEIANVLSVSIADRSLVAARDIEEAADALAREHDARLLVAEVDEDGVLHITLRRRAKTLLVGRIDPIKDWGVATLEGQSGTRPH